MINAKHELIWIIKSKDVSDNKGIVNQFFELYISKENFPDENERENPSIIKQRIEDESNNPHTNLIAYTINGVVKGGVVLEYYPKSECCLLTYIFVDKEERGTGIARKLIETDTEKGVIGLIKHFRDEGKKVKAVFFESNNPFKTFEGNDSMAPSDRLKAFYKLGAKRVDIDYIQPPLDDEKEPVSNLYLCTFPNLSGHEFLLEINVLLCFLVEFYNSLEALEGDFQNEFNKAKNWKPGDSPNFESVELNSMYNSLLRNDYAQYGKTYLKQLPLKEDPQLLFERASVCLEILVDETYYQPMVQQQGMPEFKDLPALPKGTDPMSSHNQNDRYCAITHSFETDLLAYAYHTNPPFYTRCYNFLNFSEVIVRFPQTIEFVSEGRQEMLYILNNEGNSKNPKIKTISRTRQNGKTIHEIVKEVRLQIFINYSYFFNSEIRIWHLVFTPIENHGIDEIDLIKLMKFFSGNQESKTEVEKIKELENIKFIIPGEEEIELDIIELFQKLSGVRYRKRDAYKSDSRLKENLSIHDIKNGIVGIDTDFCQFQKAKSEEEQDRIRGVLAQLFENLRTNEEGKKVSSIDVQRQYQDNDNAEYVFEAFCGITLGIFDYNRMGFEEVSDTLVPRSTTERSFLTINRGVLSSFGYGDSVLAASIKTIGINPYLQIPSAVLAHNEYVSNDAFIRSHTVLEDLRMNETVIDIKKLESHRKQIRTLLNIDFLPNVFQYPTEQDLFDYGLTHRGVYDKNNRTKANLEQIDDIIDESNANLNHRYQFWVNVLLMVISIFQIYEVVTSLITEIGGPGLHTSPIFMKISVLIFLIVFCLFISYRLYKKSSIDTNKRFILRK